MKIHQLSNFFAFQLFTVIILVGCTKVKDGELVVCKHCEKEIINTVQEKKVPYWKASEYNINVSKQYCIKCGNDTVITHNYTKCEECELAYIDEPIKSLRKEEKQDYSKINGLCGGCYNMTVNVIPECTCPDCNRQIDQSVKIKLSHYYKLGELPAFIKNKNIERINAEFSNEIYGKKYQVKYSDILVTKENNEKNYILSGSAFCSDCEGKTANRLEKAGSAIGESVSKFIRGLNKGSNR